MNYEESPREVCERGMEVREWFDGFAEELLGRFFPIESLRKLILPVRKGATS